jgi:hypothetical protein
MTARERLNGRMLWILGIAYTGTGLFVLGILIGVALGQRPIMAILVPGFAIAFVSVMIAQFFGLRCPFCRGNLATLLLHHGGLRINRRVCFCPYCGKNLDEELPPA